MDMQKTLIIFVQKAQDRNNHTNQRLPNAKTTKLGELASSSYSSIAQTPAKQCLPMKERGITTTPTY